MLSQDRPKAFVCFLCTLKVYRPLEQRSTWMEAAHHKGGALRLKDNDHAGRIILVLLDRAFETRKQWLPPGCPKFWGISLVYGKYVVV